MKKIQVQYREMHKNPETWEYECKSTDVKTALIKVRDFEVTGTFEDKEFFESQLNLQLPENVCADVVGVVPLN